MSLRSFWFGSTGFPFLFIGTLLLSTSTAFAEDAAAHPEAPPVAAEPTSAAKETKWYQRIDVGAFVDTYYNVNWRFPSTNAGANVYHPYTNNTGFNLAWAGLDASLAPDPIGVTLNLRFGPAVPNPEHSSHLYSTG